MAFPLRVDGLIWFYNRLGNSLAFSAMIKRERVTIENVHKAIEVYRQV